MTGRERAALARLIDLESRRRLAAVPVDVARGTRECDYVHCGQVFILCQEYGHRRPGPTNQRFCSEQCRKNSWRRGRRGAG